MKKYQNLTIVLAMLLGLLSPGTAIAEVTPLWEQLPNGEGASISKIGSQIIAEDFVLAEASSISRIDMWSNGAGPNELTFDIYANTIDTGEVNIPGVLVRREVINSSGEEDDICPQNGDGYYYCKYRHTLSFDSPLELTAGHYWLSVYGPADSDFGWSQAEIPSQWPKFALMFPDTPWDGTLGITAYAFRLLEPQETCPMSVEVANTNDDGAGSLRQAIADVCEGGTITFAESLSGATITLGSQLTLDKNVTIDGSALSSKVTVTTDNMDRVLQMNSGVTATIDSLRITHGNVTGNGAGILNQGDLTLNNVVLLNNLASQFGGGVYNSGTLAVMNSSLVINGAQYGGGIFNDGGTLSVMNSILDENTASNGGGGIYIAGTGSATITDCTFARNNTQQGGGIYSESNTQTTVSGSTFSNNSATNVGGGISNTGITDGSKTGYMTVINSTFTGNSSETRGNGIFNYGTLTLYNSTLSGNSGSSSSSYTLANDGPNGTLNYANTIIANTLTGKDCANVNGGTIGTNLNNLVEDGWDGGCGAALNIDPMLGDLQDNGGLTQTMALQEGSPAIDAGDDAICAGELVGGVDQRGVSRPQGDQCDIGAYEYEPVVPSLVVNSNNDVVDSTCDETHCSLREAILYAESGNTITFAESLLGSTITLGGHIWINKDLTIDGPGADQLTISGGEVEHYVYNDEGGDVGGVFWLRGIYDPGVQPINVFISGLTITDGRAQDGGGIYNGSRSTLVMTDCVIGPNNEAIESGGGILNKYGTLTLNRCTVWGNSQSGGGDDTGGGGISTMNSPATTTLINSTVSGNQANDYGGGILVWIQGVVELVHSTVADNSANSGGGIVIYNTSDTTARPLNSIVAGNSATVEYPDVSGNFTSQGGNLIGDPTGSTNTWDTKDHVGTAESPLDPMLGDLLKNAPGETLTMALQTGSPAIDAVTCPEGIDEDQRGVSRPQGDHCDIGAFELEQIATGELKISKVFDPLTSGFTGDFTIAYNCDDGTAHDGTVELAAGGSQTITGIPTGTTCTITEPTLPTGPERWTFGTPTFSPETGSVTISEESPAYAEVVVTNTISRDTGDLRISKVFDPLTSGFSGDFTISYDCDDGIANDGTVELAAGESETITGIPTGTTCTVSESTLPTAPTGWTFGTPTISPETGSITISEKSPAYAEVVVTNTISRDLGDLRISKVFDPLTSGFTGDFTISYDCDDGETHDGTVELGAGESQTITGIPTGTTCTITEPTLPTAPEGWTFGTSTFSPETGEVTVSELSPAYAEVVVTNTISRNMGELKISKVFDPLTSGFTGDFTISYDCDDGTAHDGTVELAAGESQTITGIPTGTTCTVSESTLPTAPTGWTFGTPSYSPVDGTVIISGTIAEVTVTNTISQEQVNWIYYFPILFNNGSTVVDDVKDK